MELSLFSRDTIALSTAVALSHDMFDGAAARHLRQDRARPADRRAALRPSAAVFVPGGPMPTGLPNKQKAEVRQPMPRARRGDELLEAEIAAYHSPGTCTFYGTANTNQMMMEIMGLHMPGAAFVNPGTRCAGADRAAVHQLARSGSAGRLPPAGRCVDEKASSTRRRPAGDRRLDQPPDPPARHGARGGIIIDWEDMDRLSAAVPLIARVYPNGSADVNHFQAAGGMALSSANCWRRAAPPRHPDGGGQGLSDYGQTAVIADDKLAWTPVGDSGDETMLRPAAAPFSPDGGMRSCRATSAAPASRCRRSSANAGSSRRPRVFSDQDDVQAAFKAGELERDVVVVVRFQGPRPTACPNCTS
jgi:phosphogluconate dehydratase